MQERLDKLAAKKQKTFAGGGESRSEQQHKKGKLTARERLEKLLDPGSFAELGTFVQTEMESAAAEIKNPGEGVVTGFGHVEGRKVFVYSQDFTVAGGSLGEYHAAKICKVMELALQNGAPLIGINDSGGARIQEGVSALDGYGKIFYRNTMASGVIPQLSVILGPAAGGAVYSPAITDFVFMVENISKMFITGPQVIKAVTGEEVSSEDLGGADAHNRISGVAHFKAASEEECLAAVRRLLSYLPANNLDDPPACEQAEPILAAAELLSLIPANSNKPYDIKEVIRRIVDGSNLFEVQQDFAANVVVGFARLGGRSVGLIANQPLVLAGCLDIDSSDKIARFVRFCDNFNLPLITFVDVPGYLPGVKQEYGGIIRHGAKVLFAYSEATVPKISVIIRKAYGGAYIAMSSRSLGGDVSLAWPTAEIAVMGPEGAVSIINKKEIEAAADPAETRAEKIALYREEYANPYIAAARGWVDDVIDPRDTRACLIRHLHMLETKQEERPRKKHGNMPL